MLKFIEDDATVASEGTGVCSNRTKIVEVIRYVTSGPRDVFDDVNQYVILNGTKRKEKGKFLKHFVWSTEKYCFSFILDLEQI